MPGPWKPPTVRSAGGTAQQYDAVLEKLGLEGDSGDWPEGIISHVAGAYPGGWCVVDVWESQDKFDAFMRVRLGPATQEVGVGEPQVIPIEVHNTYKHG